VDGEKAGRKKKTGPEGNPGGLERGAVQQVLRAAMPRVKQGNSLKESKVKAHSRDPQHGQEPEYQRDRGKKRTGLCLGAELPRVPGRSGGMGQTE